jgi:hypothetical protein
MSLARIPPRGASLCCRASRCDAPPPLRVLRRAIFSVVALLSRDQRREHEQRK